MAQLTPQQIVKILAKHGTNLTKDEADKVLDFFKFLADLTIDQYFEELSETKGNKYKREI